VLGLSGTLGHSHVLQPEGCAPMQWWYLQDMSSDSLHTSSTFSSRRR
jgi:hypothetical protein